MQIANTISMSKLTWIRTAIQLLSIVAFAIVTIEAKPLTVSRVARPATEGSCCAHMMDGPVGCPPARFWDERFFVL